MAYSPDNPPGAMSPYNDEFDNGVISSRWTIGQTYDDSFDLLQASGAARLAEDFLEGFLCLQGNWWYDDSGTWKPRLYQTFATAIDHAQPVCFVAKMGRGGGYSASENWFDMTLWGQSRLYCASLRVGTIGSYNAIARFTRRNNQTSGTAVTDIYDFNTRYVQIGSKGDGRVGCWISEDGCGWNRVGIYDFGSDITEWQALSLGCHGVGGIGSPVGDDFMAVDFVRSWDQDFQPRIGGESFRPRATWG